MCIAAGDCEEENVDEGGNDVGNDGDEQQELAKVPGSPRSLEVLSSVEKSHAGDRESEDVLLRERGGDVYPRVVDGELRRQSDPRNDVTRDLASGRGSSFEGGGLVHAGEAQEENE